MDKGELVIGLEAGGWMKTSTHDPFIPKEQTEGRSNDYTCKKAHRYRVLHKKAQLRGGKGNH